MSKLMETGANLSTILTTVITLLLGIGGGLWRVAQGLSQHTSRLETLEATVKKAEAEQAEILRAAQENARQLARIETDVKWLCSILGKEDKR